MKKKRKREPYGKLRENLEAWVEKNPDGYLTHSLKDVAKEVGGSPSPSNVAKYLFSIVARREGILVSHVRERRRQAGWTSIAEGFKRVPEEKVKRIYQLWREGYIIVDIAHILEIDARTVEKYLSEPINFE